MPYTILQDGRPAWYEETPAGRRPVTASRAEALREAQTATLMLGEAHRACVAQRRPHATHAGCWELWTPGEIFHLNAEGEPCTAP